MNPNTGETYSKEEYDALPESERKKLVRTRPSVFDTVGSMNRADRRAHNLRNGRRANGQPK